MHRTWSPARSLGAKFLVLALSLYASPVIAQEYSFSVRELRMYVTIQPDASAAIVYHMVFVNKPDARAIDVVDIGMPHARYSIENMRASSGGVALTDIRKSQYVNPGVEVHLGSQTIPPGAEGDFRIEFTMPNMVYQDTTRPDYASLQITPTWFGDQYVHGTTDLQVAVVTQPGIRPDELLYQEVPFDRKGEFQGRAVALWHWPETRLTGPHLVGISFPQRGMARVVKVSRFQLFVKHFADNTRVRLLAASLSILLFGILYFRFTGGTGCVLFVPLLIALIVMIGVSPAAHLLSYPFFVTFLVWNEWVLAKRRARYLPPVAQVEGGGVLRGLSAPEAAVLLEIPLHKVLLLTLFGLLKKGIVRETAASPWTLEVTEPFRTYGLGIPNHKTERMRAARDLGLALLPFEHPFLDILEKNPRNPVAAIDFSDAMRNLIEKTAGKMEGFDLSETQEYYRARVARALAEARATTALADRQAVLDRDLEWVLLDPDSGPLFRHGHYDYFPSWRRDSFTPGPSDGMIAPSPSPPAGVKTPSAPSAVDGGAASSGFSEWRRAGAGEAASTSFSAWRTEATELAPGTPFHHWVQETADSISDSIPPGSVRLKDARGGVIDLSAADRATADILKELGEGSGGGGGGGCACACAGCACACACAGGGR